MARKAEQKTADKAAKKSQAAKPQDQDLDVSKLQKTAAKKSAAAKAQSEKKPAAAKKSPSATDKAKKPTATTSAASKNAKTKATTETKAAKETKAAAPKKAAAAKKSPATKARKTGAKTSARRKTAKAGAEYQHVPAIQGASATAGLGYSDVVSVASAKFEIEARPPYFEPSYPEAEGPLVLPDSYGDTKIVGMARDLRWAYAYWEISDETRERFGIPRGRHTRTLALRVYDVTGVAFSGDNAHLFFDIVVNDLATSWYFELPEAHRSYCVDVGFYSEDGTFVTIARSNLFLTPRETVSERAGDTWMEVNEEYFSELFRMSGGLQPPGGSSELLKRLHMELLEKHKAAVSSGAFSSGAVPRKVKGDFWFQVNAELIVYGATEPNAKVYFGGDRIPLQSDGTFTLRFSLPDGEQVINLKAVKFDESDERQATLLVTRKTK